MTSHLGNFDLLKAERKSRGWSQAKVAEALGVDVATVRRWEAGQVLLFYVRSESIYTPAVSTILDFANNILLDGDSANHQT